VKVRQARERAQRLQRRGTAEAMLRKAMADFHGGLFDAMNAPMKALRAAFRAMVESIARDFMRANIGSLFNGTGGSVGQIPEIGLQQIQWIDPVRHYGPPRSQNLSRFPCNTRNARI
jgi:hypothetical protein